MSFARAALRRLTSTPLSESLPYTFGRFAPVRQGYGLALGALQRAGAAPGLKAHPGPSLFPDLSPDAAVAEIKRSSAAFGVDLPSEYAAALAEHTRRAPLKQWSTGRLFTASEVRAGRFADGAPAILADLADASLVPEVQRVARDPGLLAVIARHVGYTPIGCDPRILYSFAGDYSDDERHAIGQTFEYHFDVHSYNFVYVNIYLSDVDADSGAHVMVLGSHIDKPLRWVLGSARRSDASVEVHYGPERIRTITGPAGTGFIQDSSCYHKVLAPRTADRIMLHLRYY